MISRAWKTELRNCEFVAHSLTSKYFPHVSPCNSITKKTMRFPIPIVILDDKFVAPIIDMNFLVHILRCFSFSGRILDNLSQ